MSIFCPNCRKRLILEDYKIKSYHAVRELFTCGDVVVEKRGHVVANVMAQSLTVKGRMKGPIQARGVIRVTKTGELVGDVEATSLAIEKGAKFDGFVRINAPPPEPADQPPSAARK